MYGASPHIRLSWWCKVLDAFTCMLTSSPEWHCRLYRCCVQFLDLFSDLCVLKACMCMYMYVCCGHLRTYICHDDASVQTIVLAPTFCLHMLDSKFCLHVKSAHCACCWTWSVLTKCVLLYRFTDVPENPIIACSTWIMLWMLPCCPSWQTMRGETWTSWGTMLRAEAKVRA